MIMNAEKVIELTGLTYGQLNYLIEKVDALKREKTQGKARDFSFRDLVYLKLASLMRSDGMGSPAINEVMAILDQYWINENPNDAGTLLRLYLEESDQYSWTWSPNFDKKFDPAMMRFPKYLYNVEYYATELIKSNQLELDIMSEEMAVQN